MTCQFRNKKRATVIVEKVMLGGEDTFSFSGTPSGSISEDGGTISASVVGDTYTSTEAPKEGWELVSIECDDSNSEGDLETRTATFVATPGEVVTCTFTNHERGTIIVEKQTTPDGTPGSFSFSGDVAGSIGDGGQIVVSDLEPGTYTSTEAGAEGWLLTAIDCDDDDSTGNVSNRTATFELDAGETVKCTFTNTKPTVGRARSTSRSRPTRPSLKEPGGPVTFSVRITNTSAT